MKGYTVEKNIPIPAPRSLKREMVFPFDRMEVGDSFLIPAGKSGPNYPYVLAARQGKNGVKFSCRKVEGGHRIWRIQ